MLALRVNSILNMYVHNHPTHETCVSCRRFRPVVSALSHRLIAAQPRFPITLSSRLGRRDGVLVRIITLECRTARRICQPLVAVDFAAIFVEGLVRTTSVLKGEKILI